MEMKAPILESARDYALYDAGKLIPPDPSNYQVHWEPEGIVHDTIDDKELLDVAYATPSGVAINVKDGVVAISGTRKTQDVNEWPAIVNDAKDTSRGKTFQEALKYMAERGIPLRAVIGHSWGAAVARQWAERWPGGQGFSWLGAGLRGS